ncbi:MAG: N-acetylmuramic acid 6-phosphate etherase [Planctomycetes bacterium]|nr:N-acetylmuramic acid 6-phosphate etherase [Planctomycetota bacterium]
MSEAASFPPTEERNPASSGIDALDARAILDIIHREDLRAWEACGSALEALAALVDDVVEAFRASGRLIYVGAGTSGRLGVLDASECPPTFGVSRRLVHGIIAGGDRALRESVEEAEDSLEQGALAVREAEVDGRDVVCAIAASGTTPFVWGAIEEAARRRAATALVHCHPRLAEVRATAAVKHLILLPVGPEVVAGSTRMKSGTATKMVLNQITTAAMIRWGKVYDNLMVDVKPTNAKLRRRAARMVSRLASVEAAAAEDLLRRAGGDVKTAVVMGRAGVSPERAREVLARRQGLLRAALLDAGAALPDLGDRDD